MNKAEEFSWFDSTNFLLLKNNVNAMDFNGRGEAFRRREPAKKRVRGRGRTVFGNGFGEKTAGAASRGMTKARGAGRASRAFGAIWQRGRD